MAKPAGSAAQLAGGNTATPSFKADVAGTYIANLLVHDGKVHSKTGASVTVMARGLAVPLLANAVASRFYPKVEMHSATCTNVGLIKLWHENASAAPTSAAFRVDYLGHALGVPGSQLNVTVGPVNNGDFGPIHPIILSTCANWTGSNTYNGAFKNCERGPNDNADSTTFTGSMWISAATASQVQSVNVNMTDPSNSSPSYLSASVPVSCR
jgi:hypothetical protein